MKAESLRSVIAIDDDPIDLRWIKNGFKQADISADLKVFLSFNEGLLHLKEQSQLPTLILLDINMKPISGKEGLELLVRDSQLSSIPVVLLSSSKSPSDMNLALYNNVIHYLTKNSAGKDSKGIFLKIKELIG